MAASGGAFGHYYVDRRHDDRRRDPERSRRAADDLATLMQQKLEVSVDPTALRRFLARHWHLIDKLAHTIHDNEE